MKSNELRSLYLEFFKSHGHAIIPSASLIPENDPTVLFTTAGMHPLVPYLMGEKHPMGKKLVDVQKCVRTGDIEDVGDASHCTFFEMLGNWSLGDYFKEGAIEYSYEFLTSKQYLNLNPDDLYFTCFEGDADAPRDEESAALWRKMGVRDSHIFFLPKKYNWWGPAGQTGPCGPDSEMFIDTGKPACSPDCDPSCSCGKYLEIWNDVFMQYNKTANGTFEPLAQMNVDTGMGLDRTIAVMQKVESVYDTDLFTGIRDVLEQLSHRKFYGDAETTRAMRICADHVRCATFILGDEKGVTPSNVDQGYVLRRLIRRAVRFGRHIELPAGSLSSVAQAVIDQYANVYDELSRNAARIKDQLNQEEERFSRTLQQGLREFDKLYKQLSGDIIGGADAFRLYDTFGFPVEMTQELAQERGKTVDLKGFDQHFEQHRALSQSGAKQRFAGGLADSTEQTARLHTATHLMLAGLREMFGEGVVQKGSNITPERLRYDFSFDRKITRDELDVLEAKVNAAIQADMPITMEEMPLDDAKQSGATGTFESRYGDVVRVYTMGDFSKEICGGPHAGRTGELGTFKIKKEESSSAGVRRIKAVLLEN